MYACSGACACSCNARRREGYGQSMYHLHCKLQYLDPCLAIKFRYSELSSSSAAFLTSYGPKVSARRTLLARYPMAFLQASTIDLRLILVIISLHPSCPSTTMGAGAIPREQPPPENTLVPCARVRCRTLCRSEQCTREMVWFCVASSIKHQAPSQ